MLKDFSYYKKNHSHYDTVIKDLIVTVKSLERVVLITGIATISYIIIDFLMKPL